MNILLTCAGRRSYLVEYFSELSDVNQVHTANSIIDSPAMLASNYNFHTDSIYSKNYVNSIITYCKKHNIKMVISLLDLELTILSKERESFSKNNIFLAISNYEVCKLCNDKLLTQNFLIQNKFKTSNLYLKPIDAINAVKNKEANYPFFVNFWFGMGSINIFKAENETELLVLYKKVKKDIKKSSLSYASKNFVGEDVIIQEQLMGEEYGIDVLNDFDGNFIKSFVKKKLAMRSGETDAAITVNNKHLHEIAKKLSKKLKHYGNLDLDVFYDGKNAYILELNPRFGGGYPFTHLAGANIVSAYVNLYKGNPIKFNFKPNVKGCKIISINKSN